MTLSLSETWIGFSARSEYKSVFKTKPHWLVTPALLACIIAVFMVVLLSFGQIMFSLVPLSATDWIIAVSLSVPNLIAAEIFKAKLRKRLKKAHIRKF